MAANKKEAKPAEKPKVSKKKIKQYWGAVDKKERQARYFIQHGFLPPEPWYESEDDDDNDG